MDTRPEYPSPEHLARVPSSRREPSHVSSQGKEAASVTHDIYKKRCKATGPAASTSQPQKKHTSPSSKIEKTSKTEETFQEPDDNDPNQAKDTLSSASSDSLNNPFG